jgi:hypothetical protein
VQYNGIYEAAHAEADQGNGGNKRAGWNGSIHFQLSI